MAGMWLVIGVLVILGAGWVAWQSFTTRGGTAGDLFRAGADWARDAVTPYDDGGAAGYWDEEGYWVAQYPAGHPQNPAAYSETEGSWGIPGYPDNTGEGR